ncbi:MAG: 16S rRNA (guanine(527)-N(7))-methyltransferase RsmG [Gammaproteobacteria bacterium]|nr:16S rRNA (guanine(527)-N(7))-methyltransferase RsmG [Gammaproteobacteria bacterium]
MGIALPSPAPEKLIDYLGLLTHWNQAFNLTAIRDPREMISKHILDSLSVMPYVGAGLVADIGSGAGLPGIPLAIALPETRFVLIDSNGKKTRFLTQARITLGLDNVEVIHQRVEAYFPIRDDHRIYFDAVIARAYASSNEIIKKTAHLHKPETRILIMQGKLDESIDVPGYVLKQSHTLNIYGLEAERHLLEIQKT